MADEQRFQQIEASVDRTWEERSVNHADLERPARNGGNGGPTIPKYTKLEFPRYDRSMDPTSWIMRAEQFFEFQHTPQEDQAPMAAYHLEGDVQFWYQFLKEQEEPVTWNLLKDGLHTRFGPTQYEDFFVDLTKLRQEGNVREFQSQFERLLSRFKGLTVAQQVSLFVSGLKETIQIEVKAAHPTTLSEAIGLARLFESKMQANTTISAMPGSTMPIRRLSPTETQKRRD
ncbi:uncharacterized protein LOC122092282 [Macadamia integrifolia]|uniref:uncharacterized protein LOC122092282 n=1 Tax=Macadamia integrifolia TaxID=60698 RepID=UPI001C4F970D|nr:uncharacterized protein LOC122092282 [Macadamia integrifolia]